jgi:hypothetical protein
MAASEFPATMANCKQKNLMQHMGMGVTNLQLQAMYGHIPHCTRKSFNRSIPFAIKVDDVHIQV